jgi:hypothetical protein
MRSNQRNKCFHEQPIVLRWHTASADFLQIKISSAHILRVRIDKKAGK